METLGIVSYGADIPRLRITAHEIASVWGKDGATISKGLGIIEKSVPSIDQDTATISVESARAALRRCHINPQDIGAIYVGSESHPYAVKPTGTIVGEAIGATPDLMVADYEFACKAGTAAIQTCMGFVKANMIKYGLAIGADTSQAAPGDALEYSASAGGAAYIIGKKNVIASLNHTYSFTTDTPDFWRRAERKYPSHGGRFTGAPAYFKHVTTCATTLMKKAGTSPEDYDYAVFHQPNGKFPVSVAYKLGFSKEQITQGLIVPYIGNTYSGASMVGLASVLDVAKPGDKIMVTSYGSGAGSDGFDITVTDHIEQLERSNAPSIKQMVDDKQYISYGVYAKLTDLLYWE
ncbi:MAG: hydroxymethylglutaryl-CoA synthase [Candidatus Thermoplasmatota archaeon]|nr:hydroxymethylglutaryl-CoA synthase [Candidatus Thermoplasmatota archaeon]MBU1940309.1 hydroxymethylglutaryl-CoA synthase [Candidatus Thermoplasmatota archaeon]